MEKIESATLGETWARVVERKKKKAARKNATDSHHWLNGQRDKGNTEEEASLHLFLSLHKCLPLRKKQRRGNREEGLPKGEYATTMAKVKSKIKLSKVSIDTGIITQTAAEGALIIEIPGAENGTKANALAQRIREISRGKEGVHIDRSIKTAKIHTRIGVLYKERKGCESRRGERDLCPRQYTNWNNSRLFKRSE